MNRKPVFDTVRTLLGRGYTDAEIKALDKAFDQAMGALPGTLPPAPPPPPAPVASRKIGAAGTKLIKKWEGCEKRRADGRFDAYPDPGSADGKPWTIGWGSTGPDVKKGVIWTQAQCDARFDTEIQTYVNEVVKAIGTAPTTPNQLDALISFHYNTGAIRTATLTTKHKAGDFAGAKAEFGRWINNAGKPMNGLIKRRADEAALYAKP